MEILEKPSKTRRREEEKLPEIEFNDKLDNIFKQLENGEFGNSRKNQYKLHDRRAN